MVDAVDDDFPMDGDTRNVKGVARTRGKRVCMVTKAYSHKAVQKIMYAKEERDKKRQDVKDAEEMERRKREEEKEWADPTSDKRIKKMKEKEARSEEKARKKMEKLELYKAETIADGHKAKSKQL